VDVADLARAVAVLIVGITIFAAGFVEHRRANVADLTPDGIH
jgi:hypothetical protein